MRVQAIWEFDADVSDFDPEFVDIPDMAKDLALIELNYLIYTKEISAHDFQYKIVEE